jgi:hypothetical protein
MMQGRTLILFSSRRLIFSNSGVAPSGAPFTLETVVVWMYLDELCDLNEGEFTCIA